MKKWMSSLLLVCLLCLPTAVWAQNCVMGLEANGSDQATKVAFEWRKVNVYDGCYVHAQYEIVLVNQSSKSKAESALKANQVTHVTGCGHGSATRYTGYNQATVFSTSDTAMLDKLNGTHVHLLSCLTAQQLGPAMIEHGALSYAGYSPSFYFSWKSAARFFDADAEIDRQFALGKDAPGAYSLTVAKFNEIRDILEQEDPDAVRYIDIDRDGLRCYPERSRAKLAHEYSLDYAKHVLYARDPATRGYISLAQYQNARVRGVTFSTLSKEDFKNLVIASYKRCPKDFALGIISVGKFTRDQLIDAIKKETALGKKLIEIERTHLQNVSQARWTKTIEVQTDGEGNIAQAGTAEIPMTITVTGVRADWSGTPNTFSNVTVILSGETLYSGSVENGKKYSRTQKVSSGQLSYEVKAIGGPKNTKMKVTIYFDLG